MRILAVLLGALSACHLHDEPSESRPDPPPPPPPAPRHTVKLEFVKAVSGSDWGVVSDSKLIKFALRATNQGSNRVGPLRPCVRILDSDGMELVSSGGADPDVDLEPGEVRVLTDEFVVTRKQFDASATLVAYVGGAGCSTRERDSYSDLVKVSKP